MLEFFSHILYFRIHWCGTLVGNSALGALIAVFRNFTRNGYIETKKYLVRCTLHEVVCCRSELPTHFYSCNLVL